MADVYECFFVEVADVAIAVSATAFARCQVEIPGRILPFNVIVMLIAVKRAWHPASQSCSIENQRDRLKFRDYVHASTFYRQTRNVMLPLENGC